MKHEAIEKNVGLMIILIIVALSFGTLVELVPLLFAKETNEPIAGLKPLPALELEGRDVYIREGCNTCHSQMIRPLRAETERYGHYSVAGEFVYDHPFLFGSNVQATARAGFYGMAAWHTKAHLLRALYEGIVYGHLSHIEKLRAAGAEMAVVRLTGGGSRSPVWTQIFADALQLPMEVAEGTELGARGAAISAGIGAGAYRDYPDAVAKAVKLARRQEPNPEATPAYLARYAEYKRLLEAMQEPWDHLSILSQ